MAVHLGRPQREPAPAHLAGQAQVLQPAALVIVHPGREDGLLPGPGGDLEALQLLDHGQQAGPPLQARARGHMLPTQEEPHEVLRAQGLHLPPLPALGVTVDASQEVAGAPLLCLA